MDAIALLYAVVGALGCLAAWQQRHRHNLALARALGGVLALALGAFRVTELTADRYAPVLVALLALFVYFTLRARKRGEAVEARSEEWARFWDWFERV